MRVEGFSCRLDILYGGLAISKLQLLIKKYSFFSAVNLIKFVVVKTLDLDPDLHWPKMLDPNPR